MAIDDKLEKVLDTLATESRLSVGEEIISATIAAIPYAGSPITSLMAGHAKRRVIQRAVEMFGAMKERLETIDESKVDKGFFESDEFQTLLALALQQLQTTRDEAKLQMLACGLANAGVLEFSADARKELFIRILRDLSPNHVKILRALLPSTKKLVFGPQSWPAIHEPKGEQLAILQGLAANGLVEEFLKSEMKVSGPRFSSRWTQSDAERALKKAFNAAPSRHFRMSKFGADFLNYLGQAPASDKQNR